MRIVEVTPAGTDPYSGLLVSQVGLARALVAAGHDIVHVTLGPLAGDARDVVAPLHADGVASHQAGSGRVSLREARQVAALVDGLGGDVVHLHGVFSPPNNLLARYLRTPYAVSTHGGLAPAARRYHALRKAAYVALGERPLLHRARVVRALTPAEADDVGVVAPRAAVAIVPNGVTQDPGELPDRVVARQRLGLSGDLPVALFVGRLDVTYKRLDAAVRALSQARWLLVLVGPDFRDGRRQVVALAQRLGVADRVVHCGPLRGRALAGALAAADVFVLPSRAEGLPMALLEALAHGVPAVVSPAVERAVPVAAAGAGWVCAPEDLGETLASMLVARPAGVRAERARALARNYSWQRAAPSFAVAVAP